MLLEGDDLLAGIEVPQTHLRLQCEHELRAKHIRLRQTYLGSARRARSLELALRGSASSFSTLFRTLLRLRGESPPANSAQVIERVANLFELDARGLLGAHVVRYSRGHYRSEEITAIFRRFLVEISRLVVAIDQLSVP